MEETMGAVRAGRSTIGKRLEAETFLEPLDFFLGEHLRQHAICAALDAIVLNPRHDRAREEIGCILTYLNEGLPLHLSDEEEDLFPLLEQRCLPADRVDEVLRLLRSEHEKDGELAEDVKAGLRRIADGQPLRDPERFFRSTVALAETQRRHLAWENAVVLPLARIRLSPQDLAALGAAMAARRGIALPRGS
jgi:hemerythrin-like domain-containing protein